MLIIVDIFPDDEFNVFKETYFDDQFSKTSLSFSLDTIKEGKEFFSQ